MAYLVFMASQFCTVQALLRSLLYILAICALAIATV